MKFPHWSCLAFAVATLLLTQAVAQRAGPSIDPLFLGENLREDQPLNNVGNYILTGKTCRTDAGGLPCNATIDGAQKTLALIILGDSNGASTGPSAFTPVNPSALDNLNIYDGALYAADDPLLGQTRSFLGPGSIGLRLADAFITGGVFNRVILVSAAVGGASSPSYGNGGALMTRGCVAVRRLASRGLTSSTSGLTIAALWILGANDAGTSSANYQAYINAHLAKMQGCGFSGRIFVTTETILSNVANSTIQGAQAALIAQGTPWFDGGNLDTLTGGTNRQVDGTHFTATGQANSATLIYNAMRASGSPF